MKEVKHTKVVMEEEYKVTIEKYVKEIRETHIKLTKVWIIRYFPILFRSFITIFPILKIIMTIWLSKFEFKSKKSKIIPIIPIFPDFILISH